ncbi:hypothetical protein [Thalassotalea sp. PS06]|uniref:hypothetical protein n=1 Tax=Thalassotalea sp. PS06 TaxID=2594005 RepID=UPI0011656B5B|nr:hypothetical protein [Thalassotalea sp. PS06]QDP02302.1 hypothetical protein FNC98_13690 [Thalassotalea sp. PS06]
MKTPFKVVLSLMLFFVFSQSKADVITVELIDSDTPIEVSGDTKVDLIADFDGTFNSISSLLFTFYFEGDLFDKNDEYIVLGFPDENGPGFGARNSSETSLEVRISGLVTGHPELAFFLDGYQEFQFSMYMGSLNLARATLTATGDFNARPALIPEPQSIVLLSLVFCGLLISRRNEPHKKSQH